MPTEIEIWLAPPPVSTQLIVSVLRTVGVPPVQESCAGPGISRTSMTSPFRWIDGMSKSAPAMLIVSTLPAYVQVTVADAVAGTNTAPSAASETPSPAIRHFAPANPEFITSPVACGR